MKSLWFAVFVFAAMAFLPLSHACADEPNKSPTRAADPMIGKEPGQIRDDNGLKMKFVWCPPGVVTMENVEVTVTATDTDDAPNDDDVDPQVKDPGIPREVTKTVPVKAFVSKGYWLGKYEVTQPEWKRVMNTEPWKGKDWVKEDLDYPASYIDWNDASEFCRTFTEQEHETGRLTKDWEYRLPTEAEWERACRARTETRFSFGADKSKLADYAWTAENTNEVGEPYAHRVGQKTANPWGLNDMYGNVAEWCRDTHVGKLPGGFDPEVMSPAKTNGSSPAIQKVFRGGCFPWDWSNCGSSIRNCNLPTRGFSYLGLRVALCRVR